MSQCAWYIRSEYANAPMQCQRKVGLADYPSFPKGDATIALCSTHTTMAKQWFIPNSAPNLETDEPSYVYFIINRQASQIKIGRSRQPVKRIGSISTQAGLVFDTLLVVPETDEFNESVAHHEASRLRILGEWFEATPALLDWVESLRKYADEEAKIIEDVMRGLVSGDDKRKDR